MATRYLGDGTNQFTVAQEPWAFRNKIINGDFSAWQRGTSITQTVDIGNISAYSADRWKTGAVKDGVAWRSFTTSQETVNVPTGAKYAAKLTLATADCNRMEMIQRIESVNSFAFANQAGVLSFKLRRIATLDASTFLKISVNIPTVENNFTTVTSAGITTNIPSISSISSADYTTYTFPIPANAGYVRGMEIVLSFQTNNVATPLAGAVACMYVAQVQLEVGSSATAFEQRPITVETSLCQRYYETSYPFNVAPGTAGQYQNFAYGQAYTTSFIRTTLPFKVPKRSTWSVTFYSYAGTANRVSSLVAGMGDIGTNVTYGPLSPSDVGYCAPADSGTGFVVGTFYAIGWAVNAEL